MLKEPKNSLVKQYQTLFEMEGCSVDFHDEALKAIAERALEKGTGARGLRSIIEDVMLEIMFELPDQPKGSSYTIDKTIVEAPGVTPYLPLNQIERSRQQQNQGAGQ